MNAKFKQELIAPSFYEFEIDADSIQTDFDFVSFSMSYGCVFIECQVKAERLSDTTEINMSPCGDPQQAFDVEYSRLEVDVNCPVSVINHGYTDLVDGQKLKLTYGQVAELNKQLEYIANEELEQKYAA